MSTVVPEAMILSEVTELLLLPPSLVPRAMTFRSEAAFGLWLEVAAEVPVRVVDEEAGKAVSEPPAADCANDGATAEGEADVMEDAARGDTDIEEPGVMVPAACMPLIF